MTQNENNLLTRDIYNNRLNQIENSNFMLFSKQMNPVPRPTSTICDKKTIADKINLQKVNLPLIIQPRPTIAECLMPETITKNNNREMSYDNNLNQPLSDKIERPYRDLIFNQMTKRKMIGMDNR